MRNGFGFVGSKNRAPTIMELITDLGIGSALQVALDPGSLQSYDPSISTTQLNDLSGLGRHHSVVAAAFHGTAGNCSENEYFDGRNQWTAIGTQTWADGYNAGDSFTVVGVIWAAITDGCLELFSNANYDATDYFKGVGVYMSAGINGEDRPFDNQQNRNHSVTVRALRNNSLDKAFNIESLLTVGSSVWTFVAATYDANLGDEGSSHFRFNSSSETIAEDSRQFSSPGSLPAYRFFGNPGLDGGTANRRMGPAAVWSRALSPTEILNLFNSMKQYRYPSFA